MAYETVKRNEFDKPDPARLASRISEYHSDDIQNFHLPLERMHNSNLHDWGIARGLEVNGTIGGTEIIVHSGVAIDRDGQFISLSELADIGENPLEGENEETIVPVHISTGNHAGKTVYVTIQFFERLRSSEGVLGMLEQVPWVRLQPVNAFDDKSIVLAIAVIDEAGKLSELKTMDNALPHRRQLIGQSIEELEIQRSDKIGNVIKEISSGKIGPGDGGGLKITVPNTQDSILFAREDGSNFSTLEIRSSIKVSGHIIQENWIEPSLEPGWQKDSSADSNPPGYFLDTNGIVHLRGRVKGGMQNSIIFTLKEGFRPEFDETYIVPSESISGATDLGVSKCKILKTGEVMAGEVIFTQVNFESFSIDGITFRAKRT